MFFLFSNAKRISQIPKGIYSVEKDLVGRQGLFLVTVDNNDTVLYGCIGTATIRAKNATLKKELDKLGFTQLVIFQFLPYPFQSADAYCLCTSTNQRHENMIVSLECIVVLPYLLVQEL